IYIYPYLDQTSRTLKVRFELPNPQGKLKPEMYANVDIKIDLGKRLAIKDEAVLDTGKRQIAFVDKGDGYFEPRELKLGSKVENYYAVLSGLTEGERVITSANFLIDSESKLKEAAGAMGGHAGHGH
ncbi:MAG: efflux RND transporter periplasmic adaptor subunit, partial [Proteobacteria bacterium]|nr:efflux RND transporter periplasmic adaptor subunit [Pseudomonadota bacterium]